MESIQQVTDRNWDQDKFFGELLNKKGESDIGVNFQLYEEEIEKRAKDAQCSRVLQHGSLGLLSQQELQHLNATLAFLYSQPQTMENLRQANMVRKELRENNTLRDSINSHAAKVLIIRKDISTPNVHQSIAAIIGPRFTDDLLALRLVQTRHGEIFFKEPSDRKNTFIKRIEEIGIARSMADLLMLLGQLEHIFVKAKDSLSWKDLAGIEQPYDILVRPFGETEKIVFLQKRISSSMPVLTIARQTVQIALRNGDTFDTLNERLTGDLRADRPSLDNDPSLKKTHAFAAITANTQSFTEEQKAFYFEAGKRHRDGEHNQIQPNVLTTPTVSPYVSATQQCRHWDENNCDFEKKTGRTCKYSFSHKPQISSFTHPFMPRSTAPIMISQEDSDLFQKFKREQGITDSSSY